jgi:hypothetical protein
MIRLGAIASAHTRQFPGILLRLVLSNSKLLPNFKV